MTWTRHLCCLAALIGLTAAPAPAQALEYAVKAAFLTKFGAFVSWPGGSSGPVRLCVVGNDPFGAKLDQAAQSAGGQAITIRRMSAVDRGSDCDVVYAAGSQRQSVGQTLAAVRGTPVLTVTDASAGGARGMIHFVLFQDRVRFHIDSTQASQGGITISSKLLSLALSVKR